MAWVIPSSHKPDYKKSGTRRKSSMSEDEQPTRAKSTPRTLVEMFAKQATKRKRLESQPETNGNGTNSSSEDSKENVDPQPNVQKTDIPVEKKQKTVENGEAEEPKTQTKKAVLVKKCEYCQQKLNENIPIYEGHPTGAVEEQIALTDPKLCIFNGDESFIHEIDQRPQHRLTYFSVYDKNGHLCAFDTGLIEKNIRIYVSGYMKPIYEEDPSAEGGIPTKDIGPINEWYVSGFDGGELALIGFVTAFAEYILMEPSESYVPFMNAVKEKVYMSKSVIEFLLDDTRPSYEDMINKLQTVVPPQGIPTFTEDALLRHAQFICDQVLSVDESAGPDDPLFITSPCMRSLANLAGVTLGKKGAVRRTQRREQKAKPAIWTKATTTELVNKMFEHIFADQLAKDNDKVSLLPKRQRCGVCESCQQPDCGACVSCKDMIKFGGTGRSKQACIKRRCPNMAIQEAEDSDPEGEDDYERISENQKVEDLDDMRKDFKELFKEISWIGEPVANDSRKKFYTSVMVGDERIDVNDHVLVEPKNPTTPLHIAKVIYMWESSGGTMQFHANWFRRGNHTILGETSDPNELFISDDCDEVPFRSVRSKCTVIYKKLPENWAELGNMQSSVEDEIKNPDGKTFFYKLRYVPDIVRFEDPPVDPVCPRQETSHRFCPACTRVRTSEKYHIPMVRERGEEKNSKEVMYNLVKYKGEEFRVGSGVFLKPGTFKFKYAFGQQEAPKSKRGSVDEDMYPEFYRKSSEHVKGSNNDTPEPFCIGYVKAIYATTNDILVAAPDIFIKVNKLYRPENTHRGQALMEQVDLNMIYWSDEVYNVNIMEVTGKCYLAYSENLNESIDEWSSRGPYRFYFTEAYNVKEKSFDEPPYYATTIPKCSKTMGKGGGKGKGKKVREEKKTYADVAPEYPQVLQKLKCLDVFAGCGGLTEGLHQSGIADTLWAIEKEEPAANAFSLNNPKATVFKEDCNILLRKVMNGDKTDNVGQSLPQKGQVEFLCGGPPCQGFSGMNRFNSRQYSLFKSSLVVSYLSYCDYYRPKFFIMENVRNFVSFKRSMVLKLTLRCLVRMGYQCTFGILQAGNYGVPQTRRRMILMAAAPGQILPKYPQPTHVFSKRACQLNALVNNKKYMLNCEWTDSAPYRTISVRDAMSDLPEIKNGWNKEEMPYNSEPISHFQRHMRGKLYQPTLRDHICKEMAPIVEARIGHIPTSSGSDWRDLPNIAIRLSDGSYCKKLEYTYHDKKAGRSTTGASRGVCSCATGRSCDPTDRQFNTMIPWCLPHTGNRHNHWAGLYGRLEWEGFFSTTITNPEPMGKQGRVLHPVQTRVVSVRECARSQGFPDNFRFYGTILDKHRQVGNAVPPPLGAAVGYEIRKCLRYEDWKEDSKEDANVSETKDGDGKSSSPKDKSLEADRNVVHDDSLPGCSSTSQEVPGSSDGL